MYNHIVKEGLETKSGETSLQPFRTLVKKLQKVPSSGWLGGSFVWH